MIVKGVYGDFKKITGRIRVEEVYGPVDLDRKRIVEEAGLKYVPLIWVPRAGGAEEGIVDAWGSKMLFAFNNSGCISNPRIRESAKNTLEDVAVKCDVDSIILDALRFPSPFDGRGMLSCFCKYCRRRIVESGINPENLRSNLLRLLEKIHLYPHLSSDLIEAFIQWVNIRQLIVKELLEELKEKAEEYDITVRIAVFPPSIAWLVGQNYAYIKDLVGEVQVMLYHKCGGPACLNTELTSLVELLLKSTGEAREKEVLRAASMLTGLCLKSWKEFKERGVDWDILVEETRRAESLLDSKFTAVYWLDKLVEERLKTMRLNKVILFVAKNC